MARSGNRELAHYCASRSPSQPRRAFFCGTRERSSRRRQAGQSRGLRSSFLLRRDRRILVRSRKGVVHELDPKRLKKRIVAAVAAIDRLSLGSRT
jgi:hypothetical protein